MSEVTPEQVADLVADLCIQANIHLPPDVLQALQAARARERPGPARWALDAIVRNAHLAADSGLPLCQDTGLVVCFVRLGQDLTISGDIYEAINAGVREAYARAPLRNSVLADPLDRGSNTGDNTPAVVHIDLVPGGALEIAVMPKGGGSENASAAWMLSPAEGEEGIVRRVVDQVVAQAGKWCPPGLIGVGIGGTLDRAALLAKRALLRPVGQPHPQDRWRRLEARLLDAVNATGIGPMGLGGAVTALAVHIEYAPCHIASLPVAVNFQCHAARRAVGRL